MTSLFREFTVAGAAAAATSAIKKLSMATVGATLIVVGVAATTTATTVPLGGSWNEFSFTSVGVPARGCSPVDPMGLNCLPSSAENSEFLGTPAWEFVIPEASAILKVTDAAARGDVFDIFDFGVLIGSTSFVPSNDFMMPEIDDPDVAFADPTYSSGSFTLSAGNHSLTIIPSASPFGTGAAYFRVDELVRSVPEPTSVLGFLAVGMGISSFLYRKQE